MYVIFGSLSSDKNPIFWILIRTIVDIDEYIFIKNTIFTVNIRTPSLLNILVIKFEQVFYCLFVCLKTARQVSYSSI